jgi:hypothetical protein
MAQLLNILTCTLPRGGVDVFDAEFLSWLRGLPQSRSGRSNLVLQYDNAARYDLNLEISGLG